MESLWALWRSLEAQALAGLAALDLNDDVVLCILDAVNCDDLDAFCSVNRRVHDLAAIVLRQHREMKRRYYRIRISSYYETDHDNHWEGHPVNSLHEIHHNPRIACYVRELEFEAFEYEEWNNHYQCEYRSLTKQRIQEDSEPLLKALAQVDLEPQFHDMNVWPAEDSRSFYAFQPGQIDTSSLFVYLLSLTNKVIRIELKDPYLSFYHRCYSAFKHLAELQGVESPVPMFLKSLQTVCIQQEWHHELPMVETFMFFKYWTPVKSLIGHQILRHPFSVRTGWPVSQTCVEEVAFKNSFVDENMVESLIEGTALRSFKCEFTLEEGVGGGDQIRRVFPVLERHVASTLEELILVGGDYTHGRVLYRIGSLRGFFCLKKLVIDLGCFCSDTSSLEVEWDEFNTASGKDNLELLRCNRVASFAKFLTDLPESIESLDAVLLYARPWDPEWNDQERPQPEQAEPSEEFNVEAMRAALDKERTSRLTKLRSVRLMDGDRYDCRWPAAKDDAKSASAWVHCD